MTPAMRRSLARESFAEKIRKTGELIRLSKRVKIQRVEETADDRTAQLRLSGSTDSKL